MGGFGGLGVAVGEVEVVLVAVGEVEVVLVSVGEVEVVLVSVGEVEVVLVLVSVGEVVTPATQPLASRPARSRFCPGKRIIVIPPMVSLMTGMMSPA